MENYSEELNIIDTKPTSQQFNKVYSEFMELFECESKEELVTYLNENNVQGKTVCAKVLKKGKGAWICKDCEKDSSCIMCNECYEKSKDKHVNHKKYFKSQVSGCCDCGDPDSWDPNGFCSDHTGIITNDLEIEELINQTFKVEIQEKINNILKRLFNLLCNTIGIYEITEENIYMDFLCESIVYLEILSSSNYALMHMIVTFLMKNFTFKTSHVCTKSGIQNNQSNQSIQNEKLEMTDDNIHLCSCSFFQNLIRIWDKKFDSKLKIDKIFYTFLKSYKFKYLFAFSYFSLYDTVMLNDSDYVRQFSVQIMTIEDISELIVTSEDFMNSLFEKLYYLTNYYLDGEEEDFQSNKDQELLLKIIFEFYMDINYLSKNRPAKIMSKYTKIFKILIDVLSIIHNRVKFQIATSFQYEGFHENFVSILNYLLNLFSLLTTNFDFSDTKNADEVLFYIMDKIRLKNYKKLNENEFTFHVALNRALAIFINRYAFHESINQNIDLFMAIKNILNRYLNQITDKNENYNFENLLADMIGETLKFVGFINSLQFKYWVYYGENMLYYHIVYYIYDIFYLSDLTLLKLFLSQDHTSELINLNYFMKSCDVNQSYKIFMEDLFEIKNYSDVPGKMLFMKNLEFFIKIMRNNSYILDLLANSNDKLKGSKMEDKLLNEIIFKEENNFKEFVKIKLIHHILSKENSIYFSEILKCLPFYIKELLPIEKIEEILNEMCDKIVSKNKPILFTLKNEFVKKSDVFYIIDPKSEVHAEKYILEFKKKEITLLNTPDLNNFAFLKIINANFANHFFQNINNIEIFVNTTIFLLDKISKKEINPNLNLVLIFMKFIDIFVELSHKSGYLIKCEDKVINKDLINCLNNCNISDQNLQMCVDYLLSRVKTISKDNLDNISPINNIKESEIELKKLKMKEMKDRTAAMFKNKTNSFKKNFGIETEENMNNEISLNSDKMIIDIKEDCHNKMYDCIICRNQINSKEFFEKPYGKIGTFSSSSFLYHAKLQTIKQEFEKIAMKNRTDEININKENYLSLNPEEQLFVKDLMLTYKRSKPEMKKSLRFLSCNHYIHFSCYLTLITKYVIGNADSNKQILFICPLCKTMSNTFIPDFDYSNLLKNDDSANKLKGLTFAELFVFYKQIIDQNLNINEVNNLNLFSINNESLKLEDNVIYSASHYLEKIISMQSKSSFLINDFKLIPNRTKCYESMKLFFINSLYNLDILRNEDSEKNLDLLKDYILSLRLLIKSNLLEPHFFFNRLREILVFSKSDFCNEDYFSYNINTDKVSSLFFETIFLMLIIFEESELNYLNIIFINFLPLILIQFFVIQIFIKFSSRISQGQFEKNFSIDNLMFMLISPEYSNSIKKLFCFYLKKAVQLKNIFKDNKNIKENFNNEEDELNYYLKELNFNLPNDFRIIDLLNQDENLYPSFWLFRENTKDLLNKLFEIYFISKMKELKPQENVLVYYETMNPSLLLLTNELKFNFISIPNNLLDLSEKYHKIICNNCMSTPTYAILCLVCGEKICYSDSCCKNYGKKKNTYEYIYHNKVCGSGDGIYLHIYSGEITMALLGNFANTKLNLYVNNYGESLKNKSISDEYKLNLDNYYNLLTEFKNFSYKKNFRIQQSSFLAVEDEDEI